MDTYALSACRIDPVLVRLAAPISSSPPPKKSYFGMRMGGVQRALWARLLLLPTLYHFTYSEGVDATSVFSSTEPSSPSPQAPPAGSPSNECPEFMNGTRRPGGTFRVFPTASAEECCLECDRIPRYFSWTLHRSSGLSGLKDRLPTLMDGVDKYDSGRGNFRPPVVSGGFVMDVKVAESAAPCRTTKGGWEGLWRINQLFTALESAAGNVTKKCAVSGGSFRKRRGDAECTMHLRLQEAS